MKVVCTEFPWDEHRLRVNFFFNLKSGCVPELCQFTANAFLAFSFNSPTTARACNGRLWIIEKGQWGLEDCPLPVTWRKGLGFLPLSP